MAEKLGSVKERLATFVTGVRPFVAVNGSHVQTQANGLCKPLGTGLTLVRSLAVVHLQMDCESVFFAEVLAAMIAAIRLNSVGSNVSMALLKLAVKIQCCLGLWLQI